MGASPASCRGPPRAAKIPTRTSSPSLSSGCARPSPTPPGLRTPTRAPPPSASGSSPDAPAASPPARTKSPFEERTTGARASTGSFRGLLTGLGHDQAFMRDLHGLDGDLVLAGVEIRPFPLADPAAEERPLALGAVGPDLRDGAAEAIGQHALPGLGRDPRIVATASAGLVVEEQLPPLVQLRIGAAEAALEDDVGPLGPPDELAGGGVEATLLELHHRRFRLQAGDALERIGDALPLDLDREIVRAKRHWSRRARIAGHLLLR